MERAAPSEDVGVLQEPRQTRCLDGPPVRLPQPVWIQRNMRVTAAMAAGVTDHLWDLGELVDVVLAEPDNEKPEVSVILRSLARKGPRVRSPGTVDGFASSMGATVPRRLPLPLRPRPLWLRWRRRPHTSSRLPTRPGSSTCWGGVRGRWRLLPRRGACRRGNSGCSGSTSTRGQTEVTRCPKLKGPLP